MRPLLLRRLAESLRAIVPMEWATWGTVSSEMVRWRAPNRDERRRGLLFAVGTFALGSIPAALLSTQVAALSEGALAAIFGGFLAFSGLLAGFLVTLMLFTGRLGATDGLDIEALRNYGSRLRYLLVSQAVTLVCAMSVAMLAIFYLIISFGSAPLLVHSTTLALLGGCLVQCVARSLLLPVQIFELHDAHLDDELEVKISKSNQKYR